MNTYTHILVAIDLTDTAESVIRKAQQLAVPDQATLTLIHTIDYLPYMGFGETALITPIYSIPDDELISAAKQPIEALQKKLGLQDSKLAIELGNAGTAVVEYAKENGVDLIVIGSHGRHGVKLLLGSTANGVLHHAECDVLAVRIRE